MICGTNTDDGNGGGNGENPNDYRPIVTSRRCTDTGEWDRAYPHQRYAITGAAPSIAGMESLIDSIDDVDPDTAGSQHGRMWTNVGWSDHKHYSQDENGNWVIVSDIYDHDGDGNLDNNSCNAFHIAAHTGLGVTIKPGCGP